jgi:predicted ribosomally synthesized peptide with SipW-like signal peptide
VRRPPEITHLPRFPVTGGTCLLAIGVTLAYWSNNVDVSPLMEDANIRRGQLWRLVSSALPHGNFLHLAFNLYWTWVFGTLVEEVFGHLRTFAVFVLLAFGSGAAEYALLDGGIGLSGVGYGLFGMLWVLSRRDDRFADAVDANTTSTFVIWFFFCVVLDVTGMMPIANIAHGAGAALGALLGLAIAGTRVQRIPAAAGLAAFVVATLIGATVARPWINLSKTGGRGEFELGYKALEANRNDEAVRWLQDAVRISPKDASAWYDLAIAYGRTGKEAQSLDAYERAHRLDPSDRQMAAAYAEQMGFRAAAAGRFDESADWYARAAAAIPTDAARWFALGTAHHRRGKFDEAAAAHKKAHDFEPQNDQYKTAWEVMTAYARHHAATTRTATAVTRPVTTRSAPGGESPLWDWLTGSRKEPSKD